MPAPRRRRCRLGCPAFSRPATRTAPRPGRGRSTSFTTAPAGPPCASWRVRAGVCSHHRLQSLLDAGHPRLGHRRAVRSRPWTATRGASTGSGSPPPPPTGSTPAWTTPSPDAPPRLAVARRHLETGTGLLLVAPAKPAWARRGSWRAASSGTDAFVAPGRVSTTLLVRASHACGGRTAEGARVRRRTVGWRTPWPNARRGSAGHWEGSSRSWRSTRSRDTRRAR